MSGTRPGRPAGRLTPLLLLGALLSGADLRAAEGIVQSDDRVEIKSKVAAPIRRIHVVEGQTVRAGDMLVEMANDVERAQVDAAEAEVERAKSALEEAQLRKRTAARELERNRAVEDLITRRELELSQDAMKQAEAALEMRQRELTKARAQLQLAAAVYDNTLVRAPFDGQVARVYGRVGAMPKAADTVLLDLLSLERLYVEVALPPEQVRGVRQGMPVTLEVEGGGAAGPATVPGTVRLIHPEVDPGTGKVRVKVEIGPQRSRILPGMFARVRIPGV